LFTLSATSPAEVLAFSNSGDYLATNLNLDDKEYLTIWLKS